jgi:multidrug resistance efflux pump
MSLGYVDIEGGITPIYPIQPGRVKSIEAVENELIKAGQPLFHLEDTIPANKVKQAEEAVATAQEQLAVAQARVKEADAQIAAQQKAVQGAENQLKQARIKRDRLKEFQSKGIGGSEETLKSAEIDVENAELAVQGQQAKLAAARFAKTEAESLVAVARHNIKGKQALLEEAQNALKETVIRAPCEGMPLRILVSVGQVLGSNSQQPAIWFAPNRPLLVRAEVEQEFVTRVHKEQSVIIEDHVTGQKCASGKVVSLARWYANRRTDTPQLFSVNNDVRTLECIVKIESTSQELRIGQRVRVQFPH